MAVDKLDIDKMGSVDEIQDALYKILLKPVQTGCKDLKRIGVV